MKEKFKNSLYKLVLTGFAFLSLSAVINLSTYFSEKRLYNSKEKIQNKVTHTELIRRINCRESCNDLKSYNKIKWYNPVWIKGYCGRAKATKDFINRNCNCNKFK